MPKIMLNYGPNGQKQIERPLKRLLDKAKTGLSRPNSWQIWWLHLKSSGNLLEMAWLPNISVHPRWHSAHHPTREIFYPHVTLI